MLSSRLFSAFLAAASLAFLAAPARSETDPGLTVVKRIDNLTVPAGTVKSVIKLKKNFGYDGLSGPFVRLATVEGNVDVALHPEVAPVTVANFLDYVNRGVYASSIIHRLGHSQDGSVFAVQGGGFTAIEGVVDPIPSNAPIVNEHSLPGALKNVSGTLAMARTSERDSATSQWFFNVADTPFLDDEASTNGGYAVFGQTVNGGYNTVQKIAALPSFEFNSPFGEIPLIDFSQQDFEVGRTPAQENFVVLNKVATIPLVPKKAGDKALLRLRATGNSNPALLSARVEGSKLIIEYAPGATGSSDLTVTAKDKAGHSVSLMFTVTVQ